MFCALAALGLLWADVSWHERLGGFNSFHRFLAIPLLLTQFRRSERGFRVLLKDFRICIGRVVLFLGAQAVSLAALADVCFGRAGQGLHYSKHGFFDVRICGFSAGV